MLILPETRLAIRQALGTGRLSEEITGRALENFELTLSYSHAGGSGRLPVTLQRKPGGFFALQFPPDRAMPDFSDQTDVTLTATITVAGTAPFDVAQTVTSDDLALTDIAASVGGTRVTYRRVNGAPFDFSAQVTPPAIALQGIVLRDHDPANPIGNVTITTTPATPGGAVISNADGIFFIRALPVVETVTLELDEGGTPTSVPFRPDYARPVNTLTVSLATSNP